MIKIKKLIANDLIYDEFHLLRLKENEKSHSCGNKGSALKLFGNFPNNTLPAINGEQLLSGFSFDRSSNVLEIGSGRGGATEYLGGYFDSVLCVEENFSEASIAKKKTKHLDGVSIVCAPIQEIEFSQKFDVIFCTSLSENLPAFFTVSDNGNPYKLFFQYCSNLLSSNGLLVISTENQFGIKYFNGACDDLFKKNFAGLEGCHQNGTEGRTFGRVELESHLNKYFCETKFFYPFPDHRASDCVTTHSFLASGRAGELVSQMSSLHYKKKNKPLWDASLVMLELNRNKALDFFSNSFLIVASNAQLKDDLFPQEAIFFSSNRTAEFSTKTKIVKDKKERLRVIKRRRFDSNGENQNLIKLVNTESSWIDTQSLQTEIYLRANKKNYSISEIFSPCKKWVDFLRQKSVLQDNTFWIDGGYLDAVWQNTYFVEEHCELIDQEWEWHEKININVLIIRAIYNFIFYIEKHNRNIGFLSIRSGKRLIKKISLAFGVELLENDFENFVNLEAQIATLVSPNKVSHHISAFKLRWFFLDRKTLCLVYQIRNFLRVLGY